MGSLIQFSLKAKTEGVRDAKKYELIIEEILEPEANTRLETDQSLTYNGYSLTEFIAILKGVVSERVVMEGSEYDPVLYIYFSSEKLSLEDGKAIIMKKLARKYHFDLIEQVYADEVWVLHLDDPQILEQSRYIGTMDQLESSVGISRGSLKAQKIQLSDLAYHIEEALSEIVIDETQVKDRFSFRIDWGPGDMIHQSLKKTLGLLLVKEEKSVLKQVILVK